MRNDVELEIWFGNVCILWDNNRKGDVFALVGVNRVVLAMQLLYFREYGGFLALKERVAQFLVDIWF